MTDNGRVSLREHINAIISANDRRNEDRFNAILAKLSEIQRTYDNDLDGLNRRMRDLETSGATNAERWDGHKTEHARENRVVLALSGLGSIVASVVSTLVGKP